jgi:ribosome-associated toxin RatA of RatAB toxin-antitoxin module
VTKAISFILCALAWSNLCAAPDPAAAPSLRERLLAGEIVSSEIRSDGAGAAGRMQVLIRAPARAVWDVIVSCELAASFVVGLEACEVLEDTGERALVRQVVNQSWLIPTYDYVFESLRRHHERIDFRLLEGNLRALEGHWIFTEAPEGTFVDYQIRIQPSMPAPRFLVRRNINKGMPDMLACIRGLANGSGSVPLQGQDLARCPGPVAPRLNVQ